jgi:hypothetical protein
VKADVRLLPDLGKDFDAVVRGRRKEGMERVSALILAGGKGKRLFLLTAVRGNFHFYGNRPDVAAEPAGKL